MSIFSASGPFTRLMVTGSLSSSLALACASPKPATPEEGDGGFRYPAGSVPQGNPCEYGRDCAAVDEPNAIPVCECTTLGQGPVCSEVYRFYCPGPTGPCPDGGSNCCNRTATEGQPCGPCAVGLFCNTSNICERSHAVGEPCTLQRPEACLAPAFCSPKTSQCTSQLAEGDTCDFSDLDSQECAAGLGCNLMNVCVKPLLNGASCTDDAGCLSFTCRNGQCQALQCR